MNINVIAKIDECLRATPGMNVNGLAQHVGLTSRMVYHYLNFMKNELKAPIVYNKNIRAYTYAKPGGFRFYWNKD